MFQEFFNWLNCCYNKKTTLENDYLTKGSASGVQQYSLQFHVFSHLNFLISEKTFVTVHLLNLLSHIVMTEIQLVKLMKSGKL